MSRALPGMSSRSWAASYTVYRRKMAHTCRARARARPAAGAERWGRGELGGRAVVQWYNVRCPGNALVTCWAREKHAWDTTIPTIAAAATTERTRMNGLRGAG